MRLSECRTGRFCAAVDVHYVGAGGSASASAHARAAVVTAADPTFAVVLLERTIVVADVPAYRPGEFYLRELPPVRAVLASGILAGAWPLR